VDFKAFQPDFRYYLYETLYDIGHKTNGLADIDQMTVVQVIHDPNYRLMNAPIELLTIFRFAHFFREEASFVRMIEKW